MNNNQTLKQYAISQGAVSMVKVTGPNGAFISCKKEDGARFTIPVGRRSQNGDLNEYKILITDSGVAIATVNEYKVAQSLNLQEVTKETTI